MENKYLELIPFEFREFFLQVIPFLSAQTTDVHIAVCFQYLDGFISKAQEQGKTVNRNLLAYALILHDSRWSQMSEVEIASSLGVKGLAFIETAMSPNENTRF